MERGKSKVKTTMEYSAAFKRQVVEEIAAGKFGSCHQASQAHHVSAPTVLRWIREQGREDLLARRIRVETMKDRDELKAARARIRELEAALSDAHMDRCLEQAFLEIACEKMATTPEELKKKSGLTLSAALGRRGKGKA